MAPYCLCSCPTVTVVRICSLTRAIALYVTTWHPACTVPLGSMPINLVMSEVARMPVRLPRFLTFHHGFHQRQAAPCMINGEARAARRFYFTVVNA